MKFYLEYSKNLDLDSIKDNFQIEGLFVKGMDDVSSSYPKYHIRDNEILRDNQVVGQRVLIDTPEAMNNVLNQDIPSDLKIILIETGDWHIIPIENVIAKYSSLDVKLLATASTPEEINLLSNILELGVDGCVLQIDRFSIEDLFSEISDNNQIELTELEVTRLERIGNGDRVCVDTVSILKPGEGLLVGSTSAVQALVQAEVEESGFVSSRPFRVNAGVVASYTLNFDKTNYLSELSTGSSVMIVNRDGKTRKEYVARVKIERRPLIIVRCKHKDRTYAIVLQDAETVKLVTKSGSIRVDKLQSGDKILGYISTKARHFGMEIDETIEER